MTAGYNVAKLFTSVIYKCSKQVRVLGKPSLMFASKARAYRVKHLSDVLLKGSYNY